MLASKDQINGVKHKYNTLLHELVSVKALDQSQALQLALNINNSCDTLMANVESIETVLNNYHHAKK